MTERKSATPVSLPAEGTRLELDVADLGSHGQGVGRTDSGLVVMVPDGIPGDRVAARVSRRHRNRVDARLETLLRPSPDRVAPRCRHFGVCGGCSLQMQAPAAQRLFKARRLRELLHRQAGLGDVPVDEALAVGEAYGYRGRMAFTAGRTDGGRLAIGLHERGGKLLDLAECHLPHPRIMSILAVARAALAPDSSFKDLGDGPLRLDIRHSLAQDRVHLAIAWSGVPPAAVARRLEALAAAHPGLSIALGRAGEVRHLAGPDDSWEELAGVQVPLDPRVFLQTHPAGASVLYEKALDWLRPAAPGILLDLYAGVGVLARAGRRDFDGAVAVESSPTAIRQGRRATAKDPAIRFLQGEVRVVVASLVVVGRQFPAAAVNPPRGGLHARLPEQLADLGVTRIAYISCHPATLARDLARLDGAGYRTVSVTPFDLFPQTAEIEVLARLERESSAGPR
ncbi:MAG: TRAM domain-containing protein [Acidobacteria bacterium]|nr:TRAM domain-containing protein [Acidobacteriota bacterium]